MSELQVITVKDIRALGPCYDPDRYLDEDWQGTVLDVLAFSACPAWDRLWVALEGDWIDASVLRTFAAWIARRLLEHIEQPDKRITAGVAAAERMARGELTTDDVANLQFDAWQVWWNIFLSGPHDRKSAYQAAGNALNGHPGDAAWDTAQNYYSAAGSTDEAAEELAGQLVALIKAQEEVIA